MVAAKRPRHPLKSGAGSQANLDSDPATKATYPLDGVGSMVGGGDRGQADGDVRHEPAWPDQDGEADAVGGGAKSG